MATAVKTRRREPTEEQQQKAAERRERFRELVQKIAGMTDDDRAALMARLPGIMTCEGRVLSIHNSCLIAMQRPGASMVGGFRQWMAHGRAVSKGEHGLMIWVPTAGKSGGPADAAANGEPIADSNEDSRVRFLMGTVFDVSQTQAIEA